jgi:hypothetical protein
VDTLVQEVGRTTLAVEEIEVRLHGLDPSRRRGGALAETGRLIGDLLRRIAGRSTSERIRLAVWENARPGLCELMRVATALRAWRSTPFLQRDGDFLERLAAADPEDAVAWFLWGAWAFTTPLSLVGEPAVPGAHDPAVERPAGYQALLWALDRALDTPASNPALAAEMVVLLVQEGRSWVVARGFADTLEAERWRCFLIHEALDAAARDGGTGPPFVRAMLSIHLALIHARFGQPAASRRDVDAARALRDGLASAQRIRLARKEASLEDHVIAARVVAGASPAGAAPRLAIPWRELEPRLDGPVSRGLVSMEQLSASRSLDDEIADGRFAGRIDRLVAETKRAGPGARGLEPAYLAVSRWLQALAVRFHDRSSYWLGRAIWSEFREQTRGTTDATIESCLRGIEASRHEAGPGPAARSAALRLLETLTRTRLADASPDAGGRRSRGPVPVDASIESLHRLLVARALGRRVETMMAAGERRAELTRLLGSARAHAAYHLARSFVNGRFPARESARRALRPFDSLGLKPSSVAEVEALAGSSGG